MANADAAEKRRKGDILNRLEYTAGPWSDPNLAKDAATEIARLREKVEFSLKWAEGLPKRIDNPRYYILSDEDLSAFKAAMSSLP